MPKILLLLLDEDNPDKMYSIKKIIAVYDNNRCNHSTLQRKSRRKMKSFRNYFFYMKKKKTTKHHGYRAAPHI